MRSWRKVAVGFDESDEGRDALILGELLARTAGSELVAVRIPARRGHRNESTPDELDTQAHEILPAAGAPIGAVTPERAAPARALIRLAEEDTEIGVIALGSSHHAGLGRVLPGGTAERLLAGGPCAVAVAPRGFARERIPAWDLRVIGVGYDGTPEGRAALTVASRLAAAARGTIRVVSVGRHSGVDPDDPLAGIQAPSFDLQARLHEAVAELPAKLRAQPIYDVGTPAVALLQRAEQGIDLLVIGSRGHGPVGSVVLGSTASAILSTAPCPVVIVPRPAIDDERSEPDDAMTRAGQ